MQDGSLVQSCGKPRDKVSVMINTMPKSEDREPRRGAGVPTYSSNDLFQGKTRILIEHGGSSYVLQITRQGKLILTK